MAKYHSSAVDGPTGINSVTQDPPPRVEYAQRSVSSQWGAPITLNAAGGSETVLTIVSGGAGYSTATGVATTDDSTGPHGSGDGSSLTADITVAGGAITAAIVGAAGSGYCSGDRVTVNGGTAGSLAVLEIPIEP